MQMPGNLWREMWDSSKPVVAWRQKRLFDDTKEAEKILHSFSAMKPAEVTALLLPTAVHAAIYRLLEELVPELKDVTDNCRKAINRTVHVARHTPLELEPYEVTINCMHVTLDENNELNYF
jgi:Rab3 GTPase-activating protein catalytic subunit